MEVQDGLLAKENEELPFARHIVGAPQHFHFVEDFVFVVLMGTQEVVVGDPQGKIIVCAVDAVKTVCMAVGGLVGAVQPFDHLFERAVFRRDGIIVGKPYDLCDFEGEVFPKFFSELHGGKGIGAVAVSNELESFRQLCKPPECHAHGEDAGADAPVVRYLAADDGAGRRIHDEPDVGLDAADLDVGLIRSEHIPFFVGIPIDEGLDADSGSLAVVGDLLVGDADVVKVFQSLRGLAQGEAEVDV